MVKELLLKDNYKILLEYDEDIDYYTQCKIILDNGKKKYVLVKDNILYFKNLFCQFLYNDKSYQLDTRIDENDLAKLYIKYIKYIMYGRKDKDLIIEDQNWIGEKYICFETRKYITWFFYKQNDICIKVTRNTKLAKFKIFRRDIGFINFSKAQYVCWVNEIQRLSQMI
ncbi:MAG: hypothetical protein K2M78_12870 [Lachnospiraceae bacterium]|nr:hypothetical protein [Lachnospiraceae bacterium]